MTYLPICGDIEFMATGPEDIPEKWDRSRDTVRQRASDHPNQPAFLQPGPGQVPETQLCLFYAV